MTKRKKSRCDSTSESIEFFHWRKKTKFRNHTLLCSYVLLFFLFNLTGKVWLIPVICFCIYLIYRFCKHVENEKQKQNNTNGLRDFSWNFDLNSFDVFTVSSMSTRNDRGRSKNVHDGLSDCTAWTSQFRSMKAHDVDLIDIQNAIRLLELVNRDVPAVHVANAWHVFHMFCWINHIYCDPIAIEPYNVLYTHSAYKMRHLVSPKIYGILLSVNKVLFSYHQLEGKISKLNDSQIFCKMAKSLNSSNFASTFRINYLKL